MTLRQLRLAAVPLLLPSFSKATVDVKRTCPLLWPSLNWWESKARHPLPARSIPAEVVPILVPVVSTRYKRLYSLILQLLPCDGNPVIQRAPLALTMSVPGCVLFNDELGRISRVTYPPLGRTPSLLSPVTLRSVIISLWTSANGGTSSALVTPTKLLLDLLPNCKFFTSEQLLTLTKQLHDDKWCIGCPLLLVRTRLSWPNNACF